MGPDLYDDLCPVPIDTLGALYRAEADALADLLDAIPEGARARLAVYLHGRSHTHDLGLQVAATCEAAALRDASPLVGGILYERSRRRPDKLHRVSRTTTTRPPISLARSARL